MANLLSGPPQLRRQHLPLTGLQRRQQRPQRPLSLLGGALPPRCRGPIAPVGAGDGLPLRQPWTQQAVREGLWVGLLTTLLTSSVLAAPEVFRQSPATTLAQLTTPGLVNVQPSSPGMLLDCP